MPLSISSKPEPPKAQSNWSYQAYFLQQRQRSKPTGDDVSIPAANGASELAADYEAAARKQVIAKMQALAATIDVRLTITLSNGDLAEE